MPRLWERYAFSNYFGGTADFDPEKDPIDLAYRIERDLVITGREKDMIIINARNIWPQDLEHLAESQPELRTGDASAFAVEGPGGNDLAVLVVQCQNVKRALEANLAERVRKSILLDFGIDCIIDLVPRHTLPRTTSGKLSRSRARQDYIERRHTRDAGLSVSPHKKLLEPRQAALG